MSAVPTLSATRHSAQSAGFRKSGTGFSAGVWDWRDWPLRFHRADSVCLEDDSNSRQNP